MTDQIEILEGTELLIVNGAFFGCVRCPHKCSGTCECGCHKLAKDRKRMNSLSIEARDAAHEIYDVLPYFGYISVLELAELIGPEIQEAFERGREYQKNDRAQ